MEELATAKKFLATLKRISNFQLGVPAAEKAAQSITKGKT
jgi:hypothetical protein